MDVCACQSVLGLEVVLITLVQVRNKGVRHDELKINVLFNQTADGDDMADDVQGVGIKQPTCEQTVNIISNLYY